MRKSTHKILNCQQVINTAYFHSSHIPPEAAETQGHLVVTYR
jgi:hypothetical protein